MLTGAPLSRPPVHRDDAGLAARRAAARAAALRAGRRARRHARPPRAPFHRRAARRRCRRGRRHRAQDYQLHPERRQSGPHRDIAVAALRTGARRSSAAASPAADADAHIA